MTKSAQTIEVENFTSPGHVQRVDARKYTAMKTAVLACLPPSAPGARIADMQQAVLSHLPDDVFPGGAKSGWWFKYVQLDLEAKGVIKREPVTPLRLHRA